MNLPQTAHQLRAKAGLSQESLAERVAVTANTVARWERGELSLSLDRLQEIAIACGHVVGLTLTEYVAYQGDIEELAAIMGWFSNDAGPGSRETFTDIDFNLMAWRETSGLVLIHPDFSPSN